VRELLFHITHIDNTNKNVPVMSIVSCNQSALWKRIPGSSTSHSVSAVWNMPPANTLACTGFGNL